MTTHTFHPIEEVDANDADGDASAVEPSTGEVGGA